MKLALLFIGVLLGCSVIRLTTAASARASQCPNHYWGDGCVNYCGHCMETETDDATTIAEERICDHQNGHCKNGTICLTGWKGPR